MGGDFFQGAGGCPSGCLQAIDDSLDLSQARLKGVELSPQFFQLLSEDFALAVFGSHDGFLTLTPALGRGSCVQLLGVDHDERAQWD